MVNLRATPWIMVNLHLGSGGHMSIIRGFLRPTNRTKKPLGEGALAYGGRQNTSGQPDTTNGCDHTAVEGTFIPAQAAPAAASAAQGVHAQRACGTIALTFLYASTREGRP